MQYTLLSQQISTALLHEITEGVYREADRLPPEKTVAEQLNVSRTVVRDSLAHLEREGFISRKHGVGTLINRHVLKVRTRMDLEIEFMDMIKSAGYTPQISQCTVSHILPTELVASRLEIPIDTPVIQVERTVTADGRPAIYCTDYIPETAIGHPDYDPEILKGPIFNFLHQCCDTEVYLDLTKVSAVAAPPRVAQQLNLSVDVPVIHMDEVGYDFWGKRVLYSDEYYAPDIIVHTVMRKKV